MAPRSTAANPTRPPWNLPTGVRAPATMTERVMGEVYPGPERERSGARLSRRPPGADTYREMLRMRRTPKWFDLLILTMAGIVLAMLWLAPVRPVGA
jgi:hypothetical protein